MSKRILLLVTQADWGGVQLFLVKFAAQLQKEGHAVLIAAGGEGELWEEASKLSIPTKKLVHMTREIQPMSDWRAYQEIKQLIQEFKPDAVHLNSSKMGVVGSLACHASHPRPWTVYCIGGWSFLEPMAPWKQWLYRTAERFTAPYKDVIVTVHSGDEQIARELNFRPRGGLVTAPNGIDVTAFRGALRSKEDARRMLKLPPDTFILGTVSNAYPAKGLLAYLPVLDSILVERPEVHAVILGDGPEFQELLRVRASLPTADRIHLPGHVSDAVMLYRAFDAFVLPSRKEGMPFALLEAMAAELPCIATDVGACRWMLGSESGLVVPKENPGELAVGIRKIISEASLRQRLAKNALATVQERFSWEATYRIQRDALDVA
jgi:glycosyltransferase involved in cell wall biosynthesis